MKKVAFIIGLAIGYVLGARAGRKRYDQLAEAAKKLWDSKPVQQGVTRVEAEMKSVSAKAGDAALEGVRTLTNKVIDRSKSSARPASTPESAQTARATR